MSYQDSYIRHRDHLEGDLKNATRLRIHKTWFEEDNAGSWLDGRQYDAADVLRDSPEDSWLTVGDGMYGLDSIRLRRKGIKNVVPCDISDTLLKIAKDQGLIEKYHVENAERLSFSDESFDYVFCKESYHHFPRPTCALYEMIRVARKGVILCEPNDGWYSPARRILFAIRRLLGKRTHFDDFAFEEVGNYAYTVSLREIEKVALGLGFSMIAHKGKNHVPVRGYEFAPISLRNPVFLQMRVLILFHDILTSLRLHTPDMLQTIIFKRLPEKTMCERLHSTGWRTRDLPVNKFVENEVNFPRAGEPRPGSG